MTEDEEKKHKLHASQWHFIALCFGYNELAKKAKLLGQKVYFRFARDHAQDELVKLGGSIDITREPTILTIKECMPHINFSEKDIEMMRETVKEYDAKKGK